MIKEEPISLIRNVDNLGPFLFRHRNLRAKKVLTVCDISSVMLPSLYERFGLPPLKVIACNGPVLLSDTSSVREVAGDAELYIDNPLSCEDVSENILEIINNQSLRESVRSKGFEQAHRFSWETTVQKTINAYGSIP